MTQSDRDRRLDNLRKLSDELFEVAECFRRCVACAEDDQTDSVLKFTEGAAAVVRSTIKPLFRLLSYLYHATSKAPRPTIAQIYRRARWFKIERPNE